MTKNHPADIILLCLCASVAQLVEHSHGKAGVIGSSPIGGLYGVSRRLIKWRRQRRARLMRLPSSVANARERITLQPRTGGISKGSWSSINTVGGIERLRFTRKQRLSNQLQASSSNGRAPVSKTGSCRFESCLACEW